MKILRLLAASAVVASMSVVGIAYAFNPQPDPPGTTEWDPDPLAGFEMNVSLVKPAEFDEFSECTMDVIVIAYASRGRTIVTRRVVVGPGEAESLPLTGDVNTALGRLIPAPVFPVLLRVRVDIDPATNVRANQCEKSMVGRVEIKKFGVCQQCAPLRVEVFKR